MANEEHLAKLKEGVEAWNQWRAANLDIRPDLTKACLTKARLSGANLFRAHLTGAQLTEANLGGAHLSGADLRGVRLTQADLAGAQLSGVDLLGAYLFRARLTRACLNQVNLTQVNLTQANLNQVDLTGAYLHNASFGWTILGNVDLSTALGLETAEQLGPSTIGIDTLYRSHGNIPETFLREAGVPDEMITYSKSLVGRPFQYYSCFISYSSRDEALAQRLHADLQDKGVRCWFAPEDLKIGDEFRSRIDESIQVYDRLFLILSEYSVKSRWVQKEVETAFEKEGKENRIVLFPIRIDEAVMQSAIGWAAEMRRPRPIWDFRRWKDYDAYQQAFSRLLRDLKAEI
jgi:uncharacterized protein YjbI with pentapeptide repeats